MIWQTMITKAKEKKGFSLINILVAVVVIGILAIPMAKWVVGTTQSVATNEQTMHYLKEQMEMQTFIQAYWDKMRDSSYDEFTNTINSKGTKWTEDVNGKYDLTIEFSMDSKYANALCNVGTVPDAADRHCRRANITLASKQNPSRVESFQATRISPALTDAMLFRLIADVMNEDDKFKDYYTKTEEDDRYACPWDYKMNADGTKCVPCEAPTGWNQYRNGNCTLGTCPPGKEANAKKDGCINILTMSFSTPEVENENETEVTVFGGSPGESVTWGISGSGSLISSDSRFDSAGYARAKIKGKSPYTQTINVRATTGTTNRTIKKDIVVTNVIKSTLKEFYTGIQYDPKVIKDYYYHDLVSLDIDLLEDPSKYDSVKASFYVDGGVDDDFVFLINDKIIYKGQTVISCNGIGSGDLTKECLIHFRKTYSHSDVALALDRRKNTLKIQDYNYGLKWGAYIIYAEIKVTTYSKSNP